MPNIKQCHRCKIFLPRHYLTIVSARGNSSGKAMKVLVCENCRNIIIAQQAGGQ